MSIAEMQACLARLYVNDAFRRLFHADSATAIGGYQLTPEESAAIQRIDPAMLDFFAASLKNKRKKRVLRAFPLTFMLDHPAADRYYSRFYQLHAARSHHSIHQDVIDFGIFMEESLAQSDDLPPYAVDVVRYERLYYFAALATPAAAATPAPDGAAAVLRSTRPAPREGVEIASFSYDVAAIEKALEAGEKPADPPVVAGGYAIVFRPGSAEADAKMMRLNRPTRVVFELCDGQRTVSEIAAEAQEVLGVAGMEDSIVATINRLVALQVLVRDAAALRVTSTNPRTYGAAHSEAL